MIQNQPNKIVSAASRRLRLILAIVAILALPISTLFAQSTAFTYQGWLSYGGESACGNYDLKFTLYDSTNLPGTLVAGPVTNTAVSICNGLVTTTVDFGQVFSGTNYWLEIAARTNGTGAFTTLTPRQQITPTPYALYAPTAGTATTALTAGTATNAVTANSVAATNISGLITLAQLPSTVITNGSSSVNLTGTFAGNGTGVTNVLLGSVVATPSYYNLLGWGRNIAGESSPEADLTNVISAAAAQDFSVAVRNNGTVEYFGNPNLTSDFVPVGISNVVQVSAGIATVMALKNDGTITVWGGNSGGVYAVPAGLTNVMQVSCSDNVFLMALQSNGVVSAWGYSFYGATNVPATATNVIAIAAGSTFALALRKDGTVVAWGYGVDGETNVPPGLTNVVAISAGDSVSLALRNDGTVVAWGSSANNLTNVPAGLNNVVSIAINAASAAAAKSDGSVVIWGSSFYGTNTTSFYGISTLFSGCVAQTFLGLQKKYVSPLVPVLSGNNTYNGQNTFNGPASFSGNVQVSGTLTAGSFPGGSYTPTFGGNNKFVLNNAQGHYTQVGNMVYVEIFVDWTSKGTAVATDNVSVSLPFNIGATPRATFNLGYESGFTFSHELTAGANVGTSSIILFDLSTTGAGPAFLTVANCANSGELQLSGWFRMQ